MGVLTVSKVCFQIIPDRKFVPMVEDKMTWRLPINQSRQPVADNHPKRESAIVDKPTIGPPNVLNKLKTCE